MTSKELQEMVDQHVAQIREHVDSVRIFVTLDSDNGESETLDYDSGRGNFYAQRGQIAAWLEIQRQYEKNYAIRKDEERGP